MLEATDVREQIARIVKIIDQGDRDAALDMVSDPSGYDMLCEVSEFLSECDPELQLWLVKVLGELVSSGTSKTYNDMRKVDYAREPVSPEVFFTQGNYLGWMTRGMGEVALRDLCYVSEVKHRIYEVILKGAIGWGKTTFALCALLYRIYHLSCLRDPAVWAGLLPRSPIFYGLYSIYAYKADDNYKRMQTMVDNTDYFKRCFPRNPRLKMGLDFPSNVSVRTGGSSVLSALGDNLQGFLLDELNFYDKERKRMADYERARYEDNKGKAYELYSAGLIRGASRFINTDGFIPILMCLVSSARAETSFLAEHSAKRKGKPGVFISEYAIWEVKRKAWKSYFYVDAGDKYHDPRMLEPDEEPVGRRIIKVPGAFKQFFEENLIRSLRDIAGVSCAGEFSWLPGAELLTDAESDILVHPFNKSIVSLSTGDATPLSFYFNRERTCRQRESMWEPKLNPYAVRAIHTDLSKNKCATGMAMSHVSGYKTVMQRSSGALALEETRLPIVTLDFALRIAPPASPSRIDYDKILAFYAFLRNLGYNIGLITYDGYQSEHSIQILQKAGWQAKNLSCDRKPCLPYQAFRSTLLTGRFRTYRYKPLVDEAVALQEDADGRVFRLEDELKDVADAVAGSIYNSIQLVDLGGETSPQAVSSFMVDQSMQEQAEDRWKKMLMGDYVV